MGQQQDRLLGMIDVAIREARLIVFDQSDAIFAGNVFRGDDDKFIPVNRGSNEIFLILPRGIRLRTVAP